MMSKIVPNLHSQTENLEKPLKSDASSDINQKPLILAVETSGRVGSVAIAVGERKLAEGILSGPMRHSAEIFPTICGLLDQLGRKPKEIEHVYISIGPGSFTGLRIAATLAKTMHLANATKVVAVSTLDVIAANATDYLRKRLTRQTSGGLKTESTEKELKLNSAGSANSAVKEPLLDKIATVLDAKRGQFFIAVYQRQELTAERKLKLNSTFCANSAVKRWKKILPDSLMTAPQFLEQFANKDRPIWLLGEGLVYHKDKFKTDGIYFLDEQYWLARAEKVHLLGWEMALAGQFANPLTLTPAYLRRPEAEEKWHQPRS